MTCELAQRLVSLLARGRLVSEKLTMFHQDGHRDVCQIVLTTKNDDIVTGEGNTPCEALAMLEQKLGILSPSKCLDCSMSEI